MSDEDGRTETGSTASVAGRTPVDGAERPIEAFLEMAPDGVDFDGLTVAPTADGYRASTPEETATDLDEAGLRRFADDHRERVADWYFWHAVAPQADHRFAFLRWIEGAPLSVPDAGGADRASGPGRSTVAETDGAALPERLAALREGISREWGELRVTVILARDGERHYALRHVADAATNPESLEDHVDPADAREIGKHDDDGRYRPLSTAPSLPTGWRFPDLDAEALVTAVDFFYPATVANWYRELTGDLDVTHWGETAERQTGIYDVIEELPEDAVRWLAEACCVDSQCLKRREWDLAEGEELDVPRGDGQFPCREPCSLVTAAARKFTTLESEETRTYEVDLTLSEKNQLEAVLDAVADGTVDGIREADVYEGANRYRARYLRAKRADEDGGLFRESDAE